MFPQGTRGSARRSRALGVRGVGGRPITRPAQAAIGAFVTRGRRRRVPDSRPRLSIRVAQTLRRQNLPLCKPLDQRGSEAVRRAYSGS